MIPARRVQPRQPRSSSPSLTDLPSAPQGMDRTARVPAAPARRLGCAGPGTTIGYPGPGPGRRASARPGRRNT
eukprot:763504-Hanusia_phi.AAC.1